MDLWKWIVAMEYEGRFDKLKFINEHGWNKRLSVFRVLARFP